MALSGPRPAGSATMPDVRALVVALGSAGVRYVITGSAAAFAWTGHAGTPPGDFDIAPELSAENLTRLAALLARCGARPVHRPDWNRTLSPEECARWRPEPATAEQLDHQLVTPWGLLDVVPRISGEYERLIERAASVEAWGFRVSLAHPEDLRATIRPDRHEKHRARQAILAEACERAATGAGPVGLGSGSMPPLDS